MPSHSFLISYIMKTVLTIAGVDPFGGSGMQADIKTITAHKVYALSAVTLLTVQNSQKFHYPLEVEREFLRDQVDKIYEDISPDAVKTGMLLTSEIIEEVVDIVKTYKPKNLVVDPVMMSYKEVQLINDQAIEVLLNKLVPLAYVITPNSGETEILSGIKVSTKKDMLEAAKIIHNKYKVNVLTKSDLQEGDSDDLLYTENGPLWLKGPKINTNNVKGTGDSLSSALASNLAKGYTLEESAKRAKRFVTRALESGIQVGKGRGPIDHMFDIKGQY